MRLALVLVWSGLAFAQNIEELRRQGRGASPPAEQGDFVKSELVEVAALDPTIRLDIRYAGTDNFLKTPVYTQARAFLQRPAAEALARAHRRLLGEGYGILIHDGYRPWWVTWVFWEATPPEKRDFVANPANGSRHNRGCAADVTLYDVKTGKAVDMPSLYDEMSERAYPDYPGGAPEQRRLRDLLRDAMESEGFVVYQYEWWHYDYKDWRRYRIGNQNFEDFTAR
jgi:D-alanyl-D-alanine dipeptidase